MVVGREQAGEAWFSGRPSGPLPGGCGGLAGGLQPRCHSTPHTPPAAAPCCSSDVQMHRCAARKHKHGQARARAWDSRNFWPPKPGLTDMMRIRSTIGSTYLQGGASQGGRGGQGAVDGAQGWQKQQRVEAEERGRARAGRRRQPTPAASAPRPSRLLLLLPAGAHSLNLLQGGAGVEHHARLAAQVLDLPR